MGIRRALAEAAGFEVCEQATDSILLGTWKGAPRRKCMAVVKQRELDWIELDMSEFGMMQR